MNKTCINTGNALSAEQFEALANTKVISSGSKPLNSELVEIIERNMEIKKTEIALKYACEVLGCNNLPELREMCVGIIQMIDSL